MEIRGEIRRTFHRISSERGKEIWRRVSILAIFAGISWHLTKLSPRLSPRDRSTIVRIPSIRNYVRPIDRSPPESLFFARHFSNIAREIGFRSRGFHACLHPRVTIARAIFHDSYSWNEIVPSTILVESRHSRRNIVRDSLTNIYIYIFFQRREFEFVDSTRLIDIGNNEREEFDFTRKPTDGAR